MIKVICFFVVLMIYTAWLLIKMELVNGAKIIQSLSQLSLTALFTKESRFTVYLIGYFTTGREFKIYFFDSRDYADKKYNYSRNIKNHIARYKY